MLRRRPPSGGDNPQFKPFVLPVKSAASKSAGGGDDDDDDDDASARQAVRNRQALQSGGLLTIKRLPFLSFLSVPAAQNTQKLRQQFKSPCATVPRSAESDRLLQVKTLGMRRRWGVGMSNAMVRHEMPPLVVEDDFMCVVEDDGDAPPPAVVEPLKAGPVVVDAPPPLVLWQSEDDPELKVVVPEIVGKFLRPHQREGVQFMFDCVCQVRGFDGMGCILADDMGLGKTLQSITLMYTLFMTSMTADRQPTIKRAIVVCPTSLVKNWDDEIMKWLHGRVKTVALFEANRDAVIKGISMYIQGCKQPRLNSPQVLIISYETFRMHSQRFIDEPSSCELLICDEAHRLKNANSQINRALSALACRRRVLLSGTPMQNDLEEFFAMVDFTNPNILGSTSEFRKQYLGPILVGREPDATDRERDTAQNCSALLCEIVNQFILRRGNILNAKHLPPKLMQVVCCPLSPLQEQLYTHFLASSAFRDMMKRENANVLSSITALKKLCNHPLLIFDEMGKSNTKLSGFERCAHFFASAREVGGVGAADGSVNRRGGSAQRTCHPEWSGKMLLLDRLMLSMRKTTSDRIVIVSNYTQTLDVVSNLCRERHLPFVRLDGTTSAKKRKNLVDTFNDPTTNSFAFLLSSKAGGCGLNLIGANRLVLFDPDWNPATDKQAAARVWREGQKKMCYVYRFLATGTLEEKIFQRQLSKEGLQNIVDDKEEVNSLSSKDLKRLFVFQKDTMSDTHDQLKCKRCKWRNKPQSETGHDLITIDDDNDGESEGGGATEKESSGDENQEAESVCVAEKNYHPQIGMPPEEDLNSWGHHRSYDSVDDEVMQNALKQVRSDLVSFAFSCRIDWQLLQEHQAENEEKELQRDEERKRKRLEKLEVAKKEAERAPKKKTGGRGKKAPQVIDDGESEDFTGSSSEEEEEEENDDESEDDPVVITTKRNSRSQSDEEIAEDTVDSEDEAEVIDVEAPLQRVSTSPQKRVPSSSSTEPPCDSSSAEKRDAAPKRKISFMTDLSDCTTKPSTSSQPKTLFKRFKSMREEEDDGFDDPAISGAKPADRPLRKSASIIDEDRKESEPGDTPSMKAVKDDVWSCSRCTLENPLDSDSCGGCGLRFRRSRLQPAAPVFDSDDDDF